MPGMDGSGAERQALQACILVVQVAVASDRQLSTMLLTKQVEKRDHHFWGMLQRPDIIAELLSQIAMLVVCLHFNEHGACMLKLLVV